MVSMHGHNTAGENMLPLGMSIVHYTGIFFLNAAQTEYGRPSVTSLPIGAT